jgi:predicted transcriptional regulator
MTKRKQGRPRGGSIWSDDYYVKVFELVKEGYSKKAVAEAIGVSLDTLNKWLKEKPALKDAVDRARTTSQGLQARSAPESLAEYVYKRLPDELQHVWDQIVEFQKADNPVRLIEDLVAQQGLRAKQHLFLHALVVSNFNPSEACRKLNIKRKEFEQWATSDVDFSELVQEVMFHKKNFVESALMQLVAQGDSSAVIFANKTLNRDRGYEPRLKVESEHKHSHEISIDDMGLTIEEKRRLLAAMDRAQQAKQIADKSNVVDAEFKVNHDVEQVG